MELTEQDFKRLVTFMYRNFGIDLSKKSALIKGRLSIGVQKKGYDNFTDYIDFLYRDTSGTEIPFLVSKLTTNYTYFLREKKHYEFMTNFALQEICQNQIEKDLRIWSAGCSSGEEPYSIAMVLDDYFGFGNAGWDKGILASDISETVLQQAKTGIYEKEKLAEVPKEYINRYFMEEDENHYKVTDRIKKEVTFRKINLMDALHFRRKFHIIFCRNVMIYFDLKTRSEVIRKFYDILEPGGYLFIGLSETLANVDTKLKYVEPSIYKKEKQGGLGL